MPFKLVHAPPRAFPCPICNEGIIVQFSEVDTSSGQCKHCCNQLEFTVTEDSLKVTFPPEEDRNKKVIEKCPNCQTLWETWISPSRGLVIVHGAARLDNVIMNYRCDTCQSEVVYSQ